MAAQTDAAPAAEPFDTRALGAYLSVALKGFAGPLRVAPFAFGQSNPTFKLTTPCQTLVLRKRPSGANLPASAHAVDREFRVLQALQDSGVPVPRVHCLCMDDGVIGTPFYIMDFVPGRIFHDPAMPSVHPQHRTACYASALQALVALHGVDPASLGLASFGVQGGANFYARQVRRLASVSRQQAAHAPEVPGLDELEQALQAQVPPDAPCLIHGDFKIDNLVFHPSEPRVVAVLDWELSTLGHPLSDLANWCGAFYMPRAEQGGSIVKGVRLQGLMGFDHQGSGVPTEAALVQWYCAAAPHAWRITMHSASDAGDADAWLTPGTSRPKLPHTPPTTPPLPCDWDACMSVFFFKYAVITQGIAARARRGQAASSAGKAVGALMPMLADMCRAKLDAITAARQAHAKL